MTLPRWAWELRGWLRRPQLHPPAQIIQLRTPHAILHPPEFHDWAERPEWGLCEEIPS